MRRLSAVVFTGFICMSAVSAGADTSTALVELRGIGKSAGNSRAVISSTNLKLLRTYTVRNEPFNSVDTVGAVEALPGTAKIVVCPRDTKCHIEAQLVISWIIQTTAQYDVEAGNTYASDGYIAQGVGLIEPERLQFSFTSSPTLGDDRTTTTVYTANVGPGKHKVSAYVVTNGGPQLLSNYALVIRVYKR